MALKIANKKGTLDLQPGFSIEIEDTSPVYNDRGSQSTSATLPPSRKNFALTGHINRIDVDQAPVTDEKVVVSDGAYHRVGKMNITSASQADGIVSNIGFDESELYNIWDSVPMRSIPSLPVYAPEGGLTDILNYLEDVLYDKVESPFRIFRICVIYQRDEEDNSVDEYHEYLNDYDPKSPGTVKTLLSAVRSEVFFIDNSPVQTSLPEGYGITPFLRVSWILDTLFAKYGYTVTENPFSTHPQLSRLVVLNNSADCCVKGMINYADLMPECTINEFLQALYCRFGMVYFVDGNTKTVKLKFIKDIVTSPSTRDWTLLKTSNPVINYEAPQQLKLSAATNVQGASQFYNAQPAAESQDKFLEKYDYTVASDRTKGYLYFRQEEGNYYERNNYTQEVKCISSDFFSWDRGHNISYMDVSSVDECLPIAYSTVNTYGAFYTPLYLFGKVHRYTNISSADVELKEKTDYRTPLSFCFAIPGDSCYPFGSPRCYYPTGKIAKTSSGKNFDISLTFVGETGLFNRFWKEYDAILRHANHVVEVDLALTHLQKQQSDFATPVNISGQRLLIDSQRYTLPSPASSPSKIKFRTLRLLKPYNLSEEQTVPIIDQLYKWKFYDNSAAVVTKAITTQLNEWKTHTYAPSEYRDHFMKNEVKNDNVNVPFTIPTKEDFEASRQYYLQKVIYKFDLYYHTRIQRGVNGGQPVYEIFEHGGVHYEVEYDLYVRAEKL